MQLDKKVKNQKREGGTQGLASFRGSVPSRLRQVGLNNTNQFSDYN